MIPVSTKNSFITQTLEYGRWRKFSENHRRKISGLVDDYLERRSQQEKDPVLDFLFEYYSFRPSRLREWSPGLGTLLLSDPGGDTAYPELRELRTNGGGAWLDPAFFPDKRKSSLEWIYEVLSATKEREPSFGCFGMHEWAMVYRKAEDEVRHEQLPLRMKRDELAEFVESRPLLCTHFDAYRFFSEPARPLNKHELSRTEFADQEQPGCIHTNMDLYKWAFKMYPWISSHTIADAFELAVEARVVDMKASPYDLRSRGLEPIRIETREGRREYLEAQKAIYRRSVPVRERLLGEYQSIMSAVGVL